MRKPRHPTPTLPRATFTTEASPLALPLPLLRRPISLHGPLVHYPPLPPFALASAPVPLSSRALSLPHPTRPALRLHFPTPQQRDLFVRHAVSAIARTSPGLSAYVLLSPLGHGATSLVRLARRRADGRLFAIKALPKEHVLASPHRLAQALRERHALAHAAAARAAFVAPLVDAFETAAHLCLVTPVARYGSLADVLASLPARRIPPRVAKHLFAEMLLALDELHAMGYLYRDMKLDNLLLSASGHVKLADLGLVKRVARARCSSECDRGRASSTLSEDTVSSTAFSSTLSCCSSDEGEGPAPRLVGRTHSFVGTRRYFSPEHLKGRRGGQGGYGAPADVWALGVVLFVLVTGRFPIGDRVRKRDSKAMFDAIRKEEIRYPEDMDQELVNVLKGMLERDVDKRATLEELKRSEWMRGVDWDRVRREALKDAPREDVLRFLTEHGVEMVPAEDESTAPQAADELWSDVSDEDCRRRKAGCGLRKQHQQLLMFGFREWEQDMEQTDFSSSLSGSEGSLF